MPAEKNPKRPLSEEELKQEYAECCAQLGELESRYQLAKPILVDRIHQLRLEYDIREQAKQAEPVTETEE